MADEREDLISQFLSDADASAEDKQEFRGLLDVSPSVIFAGERLRELVLTLADWCYDEGYDDGEAGRQ